MRPVATSARSLAVMFRRKAMLQVAEKRRAHADHQRYADDRRDADDRFVQELLRRPVLLGEALLRDPDLLIRAVAPMPALRRALRAKLHALEKGGRGRRGHDPMMRNLVQLLDQKLRAEGWNKDLARREEIAKTINDKWAVIFGTVKPGGIREILGPRPRRERSR